MYDTIKDTDVGNVLHVAKFRRIGELHITKARALTTKVKAEAAKIKGYAIVDKKKGIKVISKIISEPAAQPLLFVKRDGAAGMEKDNAKSRPTQKK